MRIIETSVDLNMVGNPDRVIFQDTATGASWEILLTDLSELFWQINNAWRNKSRGIQSPLRVGPPVRLPIECLNEVAMALGYFAGVKAGFDPDTYMTLEQFAARVNLPRGPVLLRAGGASYR